MADKDTSIFHKATLAFIGETADDMTCGELTEDNISIISEDGTELDKMSVREMI